MRPVNWRAVVSAALAVVAALCVAIGGVAGYTNDQLLEAPAFSSRVTSALDEEVVRRVVADRIVDGLVEAASADLLVVRPLLASALEALAATAPFQRLFALAAADAHRAIVTGESSVIFELDRAGALLIEALRGVSPRIAGKVPENVEPVLAGLEVGDVPLGAARGLKDIAGVWWAWLLGALVAGAGSMALALERRRGLARLAAASAGAGAVVAGATVVARELIAVQAARAAALDDRDERRAVSAVWDALFADLRLGAVLAVVAGLAVAVVAAGVLTPAHLRDLVPRLQAVLRSPGPWARAGRGVALVVVGVGAMAEPVAVLRALVLVGGALALFLGVAELASGLETRTARRRATRPPRIRAPLVAGSSAVAVVAACVMTAVLLIDVPVIGSARAPVLLAGCNGSVELCERRLNEVVFPGTHNSFSAAEEPGWLFANQRHGIERQLEDGIRALLLDVHPGIRDEAAGRVRTDLRAENSGRNRVRKELSPEALATAERLVGQIGLGELQGPRAAYLCHTLCELGAEPLQEELAVIRRFLERNPSEILILLVEPYVSPADFERGLREAGLLEHAARLRRDAPLPTLGELVTAGTRLVVLTERDGGALPWYLPAFSFAQDTPLGARTAAGLACRRNRGDADSPLLLINHWIDAFPPKPSSNRAIAGTFLRDRLRECIGERGIPGAILAVDFYEQSGVVQAAEELNTRDP